MQAEHVRGICRTHASHVPGTCRAYAGPACAWHVETDGSYAAKMRYKMQHGGKQSIDKETGDNVRLRRTGPGLEKLRKAHKTLRNLILQRFDNMKQAFKAIDTDGSGLARRAEIRVFLGKLSKSIPDAVITGLIQYVDTDGDTKTLSQKEFLDMMSEEFLDNVDVNLLAKQAPKENLTGGIGKKLGERN